MSVLVVGGGITGLVAARKLARAHVPVVLVEAGPRLGGKIATEHVDGFVIEHGPDSFLTTRPAALALAAELGLDDELIGTRDPRIVYLRRDGSLTPIPEGFGLVLPTKLGPLVSTRLFSWPEKVRMSFDLVAPRNLGPEDVAVGTYLRARLGDAPVERLAGPLLGGVYGTPIDEVSLDAVVPQLRSADRKHRSLLLAGLAEGRATRHATAGRTISGSPLGLFMSLRDGVGRLSDATASSAAASGAELRTGLSVRSLTRAGEGVAARFSDGSWHRYDAVVIATPAPVTARLLEEELGEATHALATIPHGTSILVTLAYPVAAIGRELDGHGFLVEHEADGTIAACTWASAKWPHRTPDGAALFRLSLRDGDLWAGSSDDELTGIARADLEGTLEISGAPILVRVTRNRSSMPRYTVGHLDRVAAIEAALAGWPAVVPAGASYRGVGLPDCVVQGEDAATRVLERLSGGSRSGASSVA